MKIAVIGHKGIVGNATYTLFKQLGYDVTGVEKEDALPRRNHIAFICVPEFLVDEVLEEYSSLHCLPELTVIRSTVIPGTCDRLNKKYSGTHVCHLPEFVREATAVLDEFNMHRFILGACCEYHSKIIKQLLVPLRIPVHITKPTISELVKLSVNSYLTTLISYWNEIEEIAQGLGISGHQVGMLASTDPRVADYGSRYHNKFGGKCLPKDLEQLIETAYQAGKNPKLLEVVRYINENHNNASTQ